MPRALAMTVGPDVGIDIWVRSSDGDAIAWIVDRELRVLVVSDDALNSDMPQKAHLLLAPRAATETLYVVFQDYDREAVLFTITWAQHWSPPEAIDPFSSASCDGADMTPSQTEALVPAAQSSVWLAPARQFLRVPNPSLSPARRL